VTDSFDAGLRRLDARMEVSQLIDTLTGFRIRFGVTQVELAERTGMKQQDISHFERRSTNPRMSTVVRYAAGLGLRLTLDWKGDTPNG
jgi:transcriptional regulator with XRE-family HTH domain